MSPRSILVTGANGFVGRHLKRALARSFPDAALHDATFDMTEPLEMRAAIRAWRPDACVHLAAISAIAEARAQPERAWRVNLLGTLDLARTLSEDVPHCALIFASSADAYGASFRAGTALAESSPLSPLNTYAATKAAADLALGAMSAEGLPVIRVRAFNHTGPGQSADFVVAAFACQLARIEAGVQDREMRVGALDPRRDFLDVRDVCAAYVACLERAQDLTPGSVLNIASGTARRIGDVLDDLCAITGLSVLLRTDPSRLRPTDIPIAVGDASRAHAALDWEPRVPWRQTLLDVMSDWRVRIRS